MDRECEYLSSFPKRRDLDPPPAPGCFSSSRARSKMQIKTIPRPTMRIAARPQYFYKQGASYHLLLVPDKTLAGQFIKTTPRPATTDQDQQQIRVRKGRELVKTNFRTITILVWDKSNSPPTSNKIISPSTIAAIAFSLLVVVPDSLSVGSERKGSDHHDR